jgi:pimeloyl-ACP methyl ester carboxylesterase
LVIIASVYKRSDEQIKKVKNRYKKTCEGKGISKDSIHRWFSQKYLENNPEVYHFFFDILNKKKNENFLPAYKLFVESDSYNIDFSNIDMPTLIMTGKHDVGSTPEMSKKLLQEITDSELYIIPNAKHMAAFEQDRLVNSKISSFIK